MEHLKKRLLSGGAWALIGKAAAAFSGLAVNVLLARLLTPEGMGAYFLAVSLVTMSAVIAKLGLNQTVVRLVAESIGTGQPGRAAEAVRLVFLFGFFGSIVVAIILILGLGTWLAENVFKSALLGGVMVLVALWVIFRTFRDLLAETFRGFKDIRMATIFEGLLTSTLSALLFAGLWMLKGQSDLKQVIKLSIIASVATVLIAGLLMWSKIKKIKDEGQLHANEVLAIAWPLWLTNLALFALSQAALWIVGIFCLEKEVAIYGAAARLAVLMTMPLLIVNAVVPPFIAEMYALGKKNELERVLRSIATVVSIPALFISVAFFLFGGSIMGIVYGDYYSKGALVLALLSLGQLINVLAGSCGVTLMMTGHQMTMLLVTIAGGSATIGGAFLLVQRYGIIGVAVAAALAMTLQNILMLLSAKQKTNIWTHADIKRISDMKRMWIISNK